MENRVINFKFYKSIESDSNDEKNGLTSIYDI